jgi:hypothetical protein
MNWRAVWAIAGKDLIVLRHSKAVLIPLMVVPIIFLVLLPLLASFAPATLNSPGGNDLRDLIEALPPRAGARHLGLVAPHLPMHLHLAPSELLRHHLGHALGAAESLIERAVEHLRALLQQVGQRAAELLFDGPLDLREHLRPSRIELLRQRGALRDPVRQLDPEHAVRVAEQARRLRGEVTAGRLAAPFPLALPIPAAYRFVCPKGVERTPAAAAFLDWLEAEFARSRIALAGLLPPEAAAEPPTT